MARKRRFLTLPCDCGCCMFVVEKTVWEEDGEVSYNISMQDSRYDHEHNTPWGRIRRAFKALFGKGVYFNDVYLEGEDTFRKLVADMEALADDPLDDEPSR